MSIRCDICKITSSSEKVQFRLVTRTTKRSMCDQCYTKYRSLSGKNPLLTNEEIEKIEKEELLQISQRSLEVK